MEIKNESSVIKECKKLEAELTEARDFYQKGLGQAELAESIQKDHPDRYSNAQKATASLGAIIYKSIIHRIDTDLKLLQLFCQIEEEIADLKTMIKKFEIEPEDIKAIRESAARMASERQQSESGHKKMVGYDE
jgi:DNA repair ATPase RecN